MFLRTETRKINIGGVTIGGGSPIAIQSMTNTKTQDAKATIAQIRELEAAGCEIVRVAVPDADAADAIKEIRNNINIPLVADIHFNYKLAIACIHNGADKIRLNPGNIGGEDRVRSVVTLAKENHIPIRIGVNGGSLEKEILAKYKSPTPEAIVESAKGHIDILTKLGFEDIAVSLKSSDVNRTIRAYTLFAEKYPYPLHLGVTEAGGVYAGTIKSAVGIGSMLSRGIGDTLRVSLTGPPVEEVRVAKDILKALDLREKGVEIVSCPTCGRCNVNLAALVDDITEKSRYLNKNIKIAVMGCAVNGPGEAKDADIGVACGKNEGLIFKKGEILKKVKEDAIVSTLLTLAEELQKV